MAGRPPVTDPKEPITGRVRRSVRRKFLLICERERRAQSDLVSIVLQDYVAAYEKEHGPVSPPEAAAAGKA